jgi:hypothetical protein
MKFEWFDDDEEEGEEKIFPQSPPLSVGIVLPDGTVEHRNEAGQLHRLDGPAIEGANGSREWYQNGLRHRLDGPAFEGANVDKWWYQNDLRHRLDGPAVEKANGDKEWWICGVKQTNPIGE